MRSDEPRVVSRIEVDQEGGRRTGRPPWMRHVGIHVVAPTAAGFVVGGLLGAGWRTSLAASVLLGLMMLGFRLWWTDRDRDRTRGELGRAILVGAGIAAVVGWVQLEVDRSVRERETRRTTAERDRDARAAREADRRALQLQLTLQRRLEGIDLSGRDLSGFYLRDKRMDGARLEGARLVGADLRGTSLRGAQLQDADLREVGVSGWSRIGYADDPQAAFELSTIIGAGLLKRPRKAADLRQADLRGAVLRGVDLRGVDLSETNLSGADLRNTNTKFSTFQHANMAGADLRGTLIEGSISDSDLSRARLTGAILYRSSRCSRVWVETPKGERLSPRPRCDPAFLAEADLRGANLRALVLRSTEQCCPEEVELLGAVFDADTQWPPRFDPRRAGAVERTRVTP